MAVLKYNNGAWEEIEVLMKYSNSAWAECDSAYKYTNGAWTEVWSNMIAMNNELTYTMTNIIGACAMSSNKGWDGDTIWWYKEMYGSDYGTLAGTGYWTVYAEGEWIDPTIDFSYLGGMRRSNSSETAYYLAPSGKIAIYARTTSGTESYSNEFSVGSSKSSSAGFPDLAEGTKSFTLSGTFDRIGFRMYESGWSGTYYNADSQMEISAVYIDGKPVTFSGVPERWE